MTDTPWTPGPITIHKCQCGHATCTQYTISTQGNVGFDLADARLYAAAPDMAEALELAEAAMNYMGDILNNMDAVLPEDEAATEAAFEAVRAALSRAKGATT